MSKRKFRVYLAGPISGCNDNQRRKWRDEVKQKYGGDMDFIDPTETLKTSSYAAVKNDIDSIEAADGLLVNMWRESIGSAIGMVHAHRNGRPVAVANPNHMRNATLEFYATVIEETPLKAAKVLLNILRANANCRVLKSGGRPDEDFNREKLVNAIRAASRSARRNNIVVPALVLSKVMGQLTHSEDKLKRELPAGEINLAVLKSLAELENDPNYAPAMRGIATVWRRRKETGRRSSPPPPDGGNGRPVDLPGKVIIAGAKSHASIWGKAVKRLEDIPSAEARRAFEIIWGVSGITKISLAAFSRKEERASVKVWVGASKQASVIEGKLFDKGAKGTMQTFQVRTQHAQNTANVLAGIIAKLKEAGYWAG